MRVKTLIDNENTELPEQQPVGAKKPSEDADTANASPDGTPGSVGQENIDLEKAADEYLNQAGAAPDDEVLALKAELSEANDRYIRTQAEMENLRKRTERELLNRSRFAISKFAESVLSVGDNIQRAIQAVPADATRDNPALSSLIDGIKVTERELNNILERHDIKPLDVEGQLVDPNFHQAMYEIPNPDVPSGTILQIVQKGYMIGDRLLRAAQVGVAKGGPKPVADVAVASGGAAAPEIAPARNDAVDAPIEPREIDPNDPFATRGSPPPKSGPSPAANDDGPGENAPQSDGDPASENGSDI